MANQNLLRHITYCGLYCGLCANRNRIPKQASQLQKTLHEQGMDTWYQHITETKDTFPSFWQFLQKLADLDCTCRTGGGLPDCKIRQCAKQKGIEICPQCRNTRARSYNP